MNQREEPSLDDLEIYKYEHLYPIRKRQIIPTAGFVFAFLCNLALTLVIAVYLIHEDWMRTILFDLLVLMLMACGVVYVFAPKSKFAKSQSIKIGLIGVSISMIIGLICHVIFITTPLFEEEDPITAFFGIIFSEFGFVALSVPALLSCTLLVIFVQRLIIARRIQNLVHEGANPLIRVAHSPQILQVNDDLEHQMEGSDPQILNPRLQEISNDERPSE